MKRPSILLLLTLLLAACSPAATSTGPATEAAVAQTGAPNPTSGPQPPASQSRPTPENNPFQNLTPEQEACLRQAWGDEAYRAIVAFQRPPTPEEQPAMGTCNLMAPGQGGQPGGPGQPGDGGQPPASNGGSAVRVTPIDSSYPVAPGDLSGGFTSGQPADILLSGIDFDDTGGALLFNHPAGIASDGTRLLLADRNNNRVLVWSALPTGNTAPDLVLGQKDFDTNNPGTGADQMNWPSSVKTDGTRVVVADSYNDRLLIWNTFPARSGQPADLVIQSPDLKWPWGVWTDGQRLVASNTLGGSVLIWNQFPTRANQPLDLKLTGGGKMGTPRTITSDGRSLIVGDHNSKTVPPPAIGQGNFYWTTFPTADDQPFDFFASDPLDPNAAWLQGDFTDDGRLVLLGSTLHVYGSFPAGEGVKPDLSITGYSFDGGDGADVAVAGERLYVSLYNGNKIVVYDRPPARPDQPPDFAIGSPDIEANTLDTAFMLNNPVPATDGRSLFVTSDFDWKMFVWKQIPDESGARPDFEYSLPESPWDNALWGNTLALAGRRTVYLWTKLPLDGELPDLTLSDRIGSVQLQDLRGVALDDRYFYLSDSQASKVYVWEGIPTASSEPKFTLDVQRPVRLSSDGTHLAVTATETGPGGSIILYRVDRLASGGDPVTLGGPGKFNLPGGSIVALGRLFVADTVFNRVQVWSKVEDAIAGQAPDAVLGAADLGDITPEIGRDKLFWPSGLAFDGSYLWVGEFKFSHRLVRFSVD